MNRMKLLSLDLDGTLFNSDAEPTSENLRAVQLAQQNGVHVILNSGRSLPQILKYPQLMTLNCPMICYNGSQIYDQSQTLLHETYLSLADVKEALEQTQHLGFDVKIHTENGQVLAEELQGEASYQPLSEPKIYKVIFSTDGEKERLYDVKKHIDSQIFTATIEAHKKRIELTSNKASKGLAIRMYEKLSGIHFDEIYAIGDGENDIEHFKAATFSIAMGNAKDFIKEHAHEVTKSNDEHGVAFAIQHLFKMNLQVV
ncbi:Cof-type HAD-IIB family hydrolase [Aneurinibacillus sp. Ricciae_BoGa-3]|uniref:Cof-type HAD-IIB family hydrolase n=1 Tax=Aneurinibacillus sp. Ricciae_BoGa-3 TaxID=3022697 RepID=UPI0023402D79|nr:Cof-type HAD-IIB family hydrolase [Aneurinibacillus sp. Ricciae_BoGa-3]WCK55107.1 Cof-type HAD-IIB family hydrolase [Aneurinibacillus sp. Ricciae_BoGa-3]